LSIIDVIILAVVQGMTEFLPVSSSGHLVLVQQLLNLNDPQIVLFDVFVHFGTLISVMIIFRKDIVEILRSFLQAIKKALSKEEHKKTEYFQLGLAILVGSIPAGLVGFVFHRQVEEIFTDPKFAAMNIVITGLVLFLTRIAKPIEGKKVSIFASIFIGLAQMTAILPGISRSGLTMSAALFMKVSPMQAARFSFLLSIPVIIGATLLEAYKLIAFGTTIGFIQITIGIVMSATAGYVAIKMLLRIMEKGKFSWFSLYCLVVGVIGIFLL
jgi:undecaprenyl-diphosphatase